MKMNLIVFFLGFLLALYAWSNDRLINGEVTDPKLFPASIAATMGSSWCSATIVGPRVVLTAAHCIANHGKISFTLNGVKNSGICYRHPSYSSLTQRTADWVLCLLSADAQGPYENINADPSAISVGLEVLNSGYGCHAGWGTASDRKFRTGKSRVVKTPSGNNHDIVTKDGGTLCSGDSGGASFLVRADGSRVVIGVNSRSGAKYHDYRSYISSVSQELFLKWAKKWSDDTGEGICGVSYTDGCR